MMTQSFFKRTSDEWCGNWYGEFVEVSLIKLTPNTDEHRLLVTGNDDMGMLKDYLSKEDALGMFLHLTSFEDLTIEIIKDLGFVSW